jgi:hypothetical protein
MAAIDVIGEPQSGWKFSWTGASLAPGTIDPAGRNRFHCATKPS